MNILLDGHMIGTNEGGNETYTLNMFLGLAKRNLNTKLLLSEKGIHISLLRDYKSNIIVQHNANNFYRLGWHIPYLVRTNKIEVLHTSYITPFIKTAKFVITVHDVSFKSFPKHFSFRDRLLFALLFPLSLQLSDIIITPSQFVADEFSKYFPSHKSKLIVIPEAVSSDIKKIDKVRTKSYLRKNYQIDNNFILGINSKNPRKNINRLIEAFNKISVSNPYTLVILGGNHNIDKKLLNDRIQILPYIPRKDMSYFYSASSLFVYYSLYEGFGLPILEAMYCNVPVILSNIPVHREVTFNKAMYADPHDSNDLSKKMNLLLTNNKIKNKILATERDIVRSYSLDKSARLTLKAYRKALTNL